jgi:hypothetical protein
VQHAAYGHQTSLQPTRYVFPNDLAATADVPAQ